MKEKGPIKNHYSIIPNSTIIEMMGVDRWKAMLKEIKKKYKTAKVIMNYVAQGKGAYVALYPHGKLLGPLGDVEEWATKQRKKRKKS